MAKKDKNKTNVMRILDKAKLPYTPHEYDHEDGAVDGVTVAARLGQKVEEVFKTLVCHGHSGDYCVFVIPVAEALDLKKAARAAGEKSVEMIPVRDINSVTGYVRGGCSPIGMKKSYKTVFMKAAKASIISLSPRERSAIRSRWSPKPLSPLCGAAWPTL